MEYKAIQTGRCQLQIDYFVPLPLHLVSPQMAKQGCRMGSLYAGQLFILPLFRPSKPRRTPQQIPFPGIVCFPQPQTQPASGNRRLQRFVFWIQHRLCFFRPQILQKLPRVGIRFDLRHDLFNHSLLINEISRPHNAHADFAVELLLLPDAVGLNSL